MIAWHYWKPLLDEEDGPSLQWFISWVAKGLAAPAVFWLLINGGLFWNFGPFMAPVSQAQAAGQPWRPLLYQYAASGIFIIASYWVALSLAWLLTMLVPRVAPDNRLEMKVYAGIWSFLLLPVSALILTFGKWDYAGLATTIWLLPLVHSIATLTGQVKIVPRYSAAIGKVKFGKYKDAEVAILNQLEQSEDDFDGWMLLAELYAKNFKDLGAADQTIRDLCAQPNLNAGQVVTALHQLADWHLSLGENPAAAREVLEVICKAYPGTHMARMAQLRIDQLPASRKELVSQREVRTLRLPSLRDGDNAASAPLDTESAQRLADELVSKLRSNPDDVAAREKLATVFAEGLNRADLGIGQLELLLEIPDQPPAKCAEWLSQIASWQLKTDREAGRKTLERLIREFPQSAQAFAAQRRLLLMDREQKIRKNQMPPVRTA